MAVCYFLTGPPHTPLTPPSPSLPRTAVGRVASSLLHDHHPPQAPSGITVACSLSLLRCWWNVTTVGSHLSELQLSKDINYLNAFSKATRTFTFLDGKLALDVQMADTKCFVAFSAHCMAAEDTGKTSTSKVGFLTKVKVTVKVCHWVLLAYTACAANGQTTSIMKFT